MGCRSAAVLPDARSLRADLGRLHVFDPLDREGERREDVSSPTRSISPSATPTATTSARASRRSPRPREPCLAVYTSTNGEHRVFIDHGGGWTTAYIHLESLPPLTVGQQVAQGEMVGRISNSGAEAMHLHYQQMADGYPVRIRFNGELIDTHAGNLDSYNTWGTDDAERLTSLNCPGNSFVPFVQNGNRYQLVYKPSSGLTKIVRLDSDGAGTRRPRRRRVAALHAPRPVHARPADSSTCSPTRPRPVSSASAASTPRVGHDHPRVRQLVGRLDALHAVLDRRPAVLPRLRLAARLREHRPHQRRRATAPRTSTATRGRRAGRPSRRSCSEECSTCSSTRAAAVRSRSTRSP